ncbi:BtpA/SgcQ family protein [Bacillus cereus]|nr:BtpA/SgcQ family protein [Bacillus cereus]
MRDRNFLDMFQQKKVILGMLHLKGTSADDVMERLKRELDIYVNNGLDAVIIENYFGTYKNLEQGLEYIEKCKLPIPYGVNCLNVDQMGFELAKGYAADFVQLDSVVGHVQPRDEETLDAFFAKWKQDYSGYILGGVRFKYQPVLSKNTVEQDLIIAQDRCEAICVTGEATGQETSTEKIIKFRNALGSFPLIIGAGVTPENMKEQFKYADGAVIGSYFKEKHLAEEEVSIENVKAVVQTVNDIRRGLND